MGSPAFRHSEPAHPRSAPTRPGSLRVRDVARAAESLPLPCAGAVPRLTRAARDGPGRMERETGIEPETCSLEGRGDHALQHRTQGRERMVSSYRVVRHAILIPATGAADHVWICDICPDSVGVAQVPTAALR